MASKKSSGKKGGITKRELIFLAIAVILLVALVVVLVTNSNLNDLFGQSGGDNDKTETPSTPTPANYSFHSGNATICLPSEFNIEEMAEVHFIDIGQGDAIFISFPSGETVLIDAGCSTGYYYENKSGNITTNVSKDVRDAYLAYLAALNITSITHMIATHPDADHVNMLALTLKEYVVENIYYNYIEEHSATYDYFLAMAENEVTESNANLMQIGDKTGEWEWAIESEEWGYRLDVFAPGNDAFEDVNSKSIMCLLDYGGVKTLFTGDAHDDEEEWLMELFKEKYSVTSYDIDILKVGHHGSNSSSSVGFLEFFTPEYGVISVGETNGYNHPTPFAMNRLFDAGVVTYRTNRHGNIVLYIDSDGTFGFLPENNVTVDNNKNYIEEKRLSEVPAAA